MDSMKYLIENRNAAEYLLTRMDFKNEDEALVDPKHQTSITFKNISKNTSKFSIFLKNSGTKRGDVVVLCLKNTVDFPWYFLGTLYANATCALISPCLKLDELRHILDLCQPKLFIHSPLDKEELDLIQSFKGMKCIATQEFSLPDYEFSIEMDSSANLMSKGDDAALILMSSGSTGLPKAVLLSHHSILALVTNSTFILGEFGKALGLIPFFHSYGIFLLLCSLNIHGKIVIMDTFDIEEMVNIVEEQQLTHLHLVPSLLTRLVKQGLIKKDKFKSLQMFWTGASNVNAKHQEEVLRELKHIKMYHAYGLSEVTNITIYGEYRHDKMGSTGQLVPFLQCRIINENGDICKIGEVGELRFKGPTVMKGYFNNEAATRDAFDEDGWLRSGDLGYVDKDGYYFIVDRIKEMIKYQGHQISPNEIEMTLLQLKEVADAVVIGIPHEIYGEIPRAYVVRRSSGITEKEIEDFIEGKLSQLNKLRGGVKFIGIIPKTLSGKTDRKEVKKIYSQKNI